MSFHSIFLIIDSDGPHVANYERCRAVWRRYMNIRPDIKCIFIRSNPYQNDHILYNEETNTLSFKRNESYIPGILDNTIDAFKYCIDNYSFNFITRTNLSSIWNFKKYMDYINSINDQFFVAGIIGNHNYLFVSGAGFTMPCATVRKVIEYKDELGSTYLDDVEFGKLFTVKNFKLINGKRLDYTDIINHSIDNDYESIVNNYHYRVLFYIGEQDKFISNKIVDMIYYL
jgi:hypothetical protein